MEKITLQVEGMSCSHCEAAVKGALSALSGVAGVTVSLADKTVQVDYDGGAVTAEVMREAIEEQGYDVVG